MIAQGRAERRRRAVPPWVKGPPGFPSPERALHPGAGKAMPQSLVKNLVHLVFSTKHRKSQLSDDDQDSLYAS